MRRSARDMQALNEMLLEDNNVLRERIRGKQTQNFDANTLKSREVVRRNSRTAKEAFKTNNQSIK